MWYEVLLNPDRKARLASARDSILVSRGRYTRVHIPPSPSPSLLSLSVPLACCPRLSYTAGINSYGRCGKKKTALMLYHVCTYLPYLGRENVPLSYLCTRTVVRLARRYHQSIKGSVDGVAGRLRLVAGVRTCIMQHTATGRRRHPHQTLAS